MRLWSQYIISYYFGMSGFSSISNDQLKGLCFGLARPIYNENSLPEVHMVFYNPSWNENVP